uniref:ATP-binding response regulator n=1 Tax=Agathobacter sp. TaxID=2021311 RepID=UPI00405695F5
MSDFGKVVSGYEFYDIVFERLNIYFFKYDITRKAVFIPEKTKCVFGCKDVYENMPISFADEFVADEYRKSFFQFYEDCNNGKENCECVFEDKAHTFLLCVKLQIMERDADGNPLVAIGIIENQVEVKKLLHKHNKYIDTILSNAVGYMEINLTKNEIEGDVIDARRKKDVLIGTHLEQPHVKKEYDAFERWWSEHRLVSDKEEFLRVSNCKYLISSFEKGKHMVDVFCSSLTEEGNVTDNRQTYYLSRDEMTGDIVAMCVVYDLTKQHEQERDAHHKNLVIQKLCDRFDAICYVNLDNGTMIDYRVDNVFSSWEDEQKENFNYMQRVEQFANEFVLDEDKEKYKKYMSPEVIKSRLQEKPFYIFDYRVKKDGEVHYFNARIVQDDSEKNHFSVIIGFRNIDDAVQQHKLVKETMKYAEHATKAKANFLSNMSHDMRTPMNAIVGFTALAAAHLEEKEKVQGYLKKIAASSNHLLSLINDILDMSRIESGKVVLNEHEENLAEILHDLRAMVQPQVNAKQMDFFIDTCDVRDELIYCDKLRLKQVLLNIFTNAVKYTAPGGTVAVRIVQKEKQQREYGNYEFRIKDNGRGMSQEFMEHIFEPFTREEKSSSDANPGTGLGLSIVKNIVDMMNGTIEVKSRQGKGSEFIVSLAFKLQKGKRVDYDFSKIEGFRALVVDDDFHTCDTVTRMLREIGMRPEFSMHGKEAILKAKQAHDLQDDFFVYIIDWLMPDINGLEVVRRIRKEIGNEIPIIILTAYDWECIREEAKEAGVTAICEKPLFMSNLKKIIATSCGWEKAEKEEESCVSMDFSGKKVLLAEDIEINQEIANEILSDKGFEVTIAEDGKQALEILEQAKPGEYDIVLMDIRMPVMDGYEATRQIRQLDSEYRNIPIVAMTANAFEDDRQMSFRVGMNEHVSKPLEEEYLFSVLWNLLNCK